MKRIEAFLKHRTQFVVFNGSHSSTALVTSEVTQGTVLGPTLFLIFINDIVNCSTSTLRLFADDCCVYRQVNSSDDHRALYQDLTNLHNWSNDWQMSFNIAKCKLLSITNKRKPSIYTYNLGSEQISTETAQKYLAVTINNKLRWEDHYNITAHKANRTLGIVRRLLKPCEQDVKKRACEALVRPQMEYASSAWSPHTDRDTNKLEQVQKNAARFVTGDYRLTTKLQPSSSQSAGTLLRRGAYYFKPPCCVRSVTSWLIFLYSRHRITDEIPILACPRPCLPTIGDKCTELWVLLLPTSYQGLATTYIRGLQAPGHLRKF